jgi:hypothetical protein
MEYYSTLERKKKNAPLNTELEHMKPIGNHVAWYRMDES